MTDADGPANAHGADVADANGPRHETNSGASDASCRIANVCAVDRGVSDLCRRGKPRERETSRRHCSKYRSDYLHFRSPIETSERQRSIVGYTDAKSRAMWRDAAPMDGRVRDGRFSTLATSCWCLDRGLLRAEMRRYRVTPNARSPVDSGCSLRDPCRSAVRPNRKFTVFSRGISEAFGVGPRVNLSLTLRPGGRQDWARHLPFSIGREQQKSALSGLRTSRTITATIPRAGGV